MLHEQMMNPSLRFTDSPDDRADTAGVETNALGQPVGQLIPGWVPRQMPAASMLTGRYCRLERLNPERHAEELFAADRCDLPGASWTYLPYGPFADLASYRQWIEQVCRADDLHFYAIIDIDPATGSIGERAVGVLSYLRVQPDAGSIEVGHVHYSRVLQRSRPATEAQYLLMHHAFQDLGYRRYEWKCDALNVASRAAAGRLGFPTRELSGRQRWSRAATAIPPGTQSSIRNGRSSGSVLSPGWLRTTLTIKPVRGRRCTARSRPGSPKPFRGRRGPEAASQTRAFSWSRSSGARGRCITIRPTGRNRHHCRATPVAVGTGFAISLRMRLRFHRRKLEALPELEAILPKGPG